MAKPTEESAKVFSISFDAVISPGSAADGMPVGPVADVDCKLLQFGDTSANGVQILPIHFFVAFPPPGDHLV